MTTQPLFRGTPGIPILFKGNDHGTVFRPIHYRRPGIDENSFAILPANSILVTKLPRIDGKTIEFERYKTWQLDWHTRSRMTFYAENVAVAPETECAEEPPEPERHRFMLKVAFHVNPGSSGHCLMEKYREEALFFKDHLSQVEGRVVPKHYGVWWGMSAWGVRVAVSIMEWGGEPYRRGIMKAGLETEESKNAVLEALRILHAEARIVHGNLILDEARHILYDKERDKACVVDFKYAELDHDCGLRMPLFKSYNSIAPEDVFGCRELTRACKFLGKMKCERSFDEDPEMMEYVEAYDRECRENQQKKREERKRILAELERRGIKLPELLALKMKGRSA